jgi:hypothetical protein
MSNPTTYYFNTGGVEWTAAELEAVLTQGESSHVWSGESSPTRYADGEGWESWGELSYGDHIVQIDGVDHKIEVVSMHESRDWSYEAFVVFLLEGRYFRVDGEFESYSGTTWGPLQEVSLKTKTVEVYE